MRPLLYRLSYRAEMTRMYAPRRSGKSSMGNRPAKECKGGTRRERLAYDALPLLRNFGGPIMANVKVVTVTFAGDTTRDAKRLFDDTIVQSTWWTAAVGEYGVGRGSSGGYVELPDTVSNKTIDNTNDIIPM